MRIKFLGTGSGLTSLKRFHSSFLVSTQTQNILIDCGDGISRAILNQKTNFNSINSILISHLHPDHYTGLPALITQMKLTGRKNDLCVYIHSFNKKFIEDFLLNSYLFDDRMGFITKIISFDEETVIELGDDLSFTSKLNSHLEKYRTKELEHKLGFVSLSFLFNDSENSCIYTSDVGSGKDLFLFNQKVDWFITESTHIELKNLLQVFERLNPKKIILTHIADDFEQNLTVFLNSLPNHLKSAFILAFDGLELNQFT